MSELNLVLLGPPGAGKGRRLNGSSRTSACPTTPPGSSCARPWPRGSQSSASRPRSTWTDGELVPDELINEVIAERLDSGEADDGFLLDGFPRTTARRRCSRRLLEGRGRELSGVLLIEAPDDEVVRRLSGRRNCAKGEHVYHVEFDPPKHEGVCDQDGSRLIRRDGDKAETVRKRSRSTTTRPSR